MREAQLGPESFDEPNGLRNGILLRLCKLTPPCLKFVGELDRPHYTELYPAGNNLSETATNNPGSKNPQHGCNQGDGGP